MAGGDVPHDRPFIIEICPGSTACSHFEDDAAEGPNVDTTVAAVVTSGNN